MIRIETKLSEKDRGLGLIEAYRAAPVGANVDVRVGNTEAGDPCVLVEIGIQFFPMLTPTARTLASIIDGAVREHGDTQGISNLATALRHASDIAEARPPLATTGRGADE